MLDNALVAQKDCIIGKIDDGQYEEAIILLKFVKDLWEKVNYAYKWRELRERGIVATTNYDESRHWKQVQALDTIKNKFRSL